MKFFCGNACSYMFDSMYLRAFRKPGLTANDKWFSNLSWGRLRQFTKGNA